MTSHHGLYGEAELFFSRMWPSTDGPTSDRFDFAGDVHLQGTAERWVKMMKELTTPEEYTFTTFPSEGDEMIIIKDIPFTSLCAHHLVPFVGVCHIGYVPFQQMAGLSKFARLVKANSRDLTVQERLTTAIAADLERKLEPLGVAVYMEAEHMCMTIRGVQTPGTKTITSHMAGVFADHSKLARSEFLAMIKS